MDILATLYHSCHREICQEEAHYPFAIVNYISLLGEAMGIEHPDVYKRYKLRADPEAVFEEVQPSPCERTRSRPSSRGPAQSLCARM